MVSVERVKEYMDTRSEVLLKKVLQFKESYV
jgi:hypothetical protein